MTEHLSVIPAGDAGERDMLLGWLEFHRRSVLRKTDGLTDEQARWAPTATANPLMRLLHHLGYVERYWMQDVFAGRDVEYPAPPDQDFPLPDDWTLEHARAWYRTESAETDRIARAQPDLGRLSARAPGWMASEPATLRWILVHLIEETARHAGHADITRELIDGATGL